MTKLELEKLKKADEVITQFEYIKDGVNENGFDTFKIVYIDNPLNFSLVHIDVDSKLAILKNLDYVI